MEVFIITLRTFTFATCPLSRNAVIPNPKSYDFFSTVNSTIVPGVDTRMGTDKVFPASTPTSLPVKYPSLTSYDVKERPAMSFINSDVFSITLSDG